MWSPPSVRSSSGPRSCSSSPTSGCPGARRWRPATTHGTAAGSSGSPRHHHPTTTSPTCPPSVRSGRSGTTTILSTARHTVQEQIRCPTRKRSTQERTHEGGRPVPRRTRHLLRHHRHRVLGLQLRGRRLPHADGLGAARHPPRLLLPVVGCLL